MTNLSTQLDSGSFIEEANGTLSCRGAASVEKSSVIISVKREGLLRSERERVRCGDVFGTVGVGQGVDMGMSHSAVSSAGGTCIGLL